MHYIFDLKNFSLIDVCLGIVLGIIICYFTLIALNKIKIYKWIKITFGLFLYFFVVSFLGYLGLEYTHWMFNSEHDSFAGSFIGGIIGGVVAYVIALQQINHNKKQELEALKRSYEATIVALESELEYNLNILDKFLNHLPKEQSYDLKVKIPFRTRIWDQVSLRAEFIKNITKEEYKKISSVYSEITLFTESSTDLKTLNQLKRNIQNIKEIISNKK
jgi:gas vesicle protein